MNAITLTITQAEAGQGCTVDFSSTGSGTVLDVAQMHAAMIDAAARLTVQMSEILKDSRDGFLFDHALELELARMAQNQPNQSGSTRFREVEERGQ